MKIFMHLELSFTIMEIKIFENKMIERYRGRDGVIGRHEFL